jgi:hypothetical protein
MDRSDITNTGYAQQDARRRIQSLHFPWSPLEKSCEIRTFFAAISTFVQHSGARAVAEARPPEVVELVQIALLSS